MPQCGFSFEFRQTGAHRSSRSLNGYNPDAGWINGPNRQHEASERTKVGSVGRKDSSTKAVSPKKSSTQRNTFSRLTNCNAVGRRRRSNVTGCATTDFGFGVTRCYKPEKTAPDPGLSASEKKQSKKYFMCKNKRKKVVTAPGNYEPLLMPPHEKEDWDEETQEVALGDKAKVNVASIPYGPEDALQFSLQDLTLQQGIGADPPASTNYSPAVHHAQPTRWSCCRFSTESDQFADAGE